MRRAVGMPYLWPALALVLVLAIRMVSPSDLGGHDDQSKTLAFTADVVLNGEWVLPRDDAGARAMKPPLVNWVGALLPGLGLWEEWALKFPSMLGAALVVAFTVWMTRRMLLAAEAPAPPGPRPPVPPASTGPSGAGATTPEAVATGTWAAHRRWAAAVGAAAGVVVLAGEDTMKHAYFLRPDMLNLAFLTAAWALGTVALCRRDARARAASLGFWLAVGGAFLTKGPAALIPILYLFLAARVLHGRWSVVERAGWRWGLPLALGPFLAWLVLAYRVAPDHVIHRLIGTETVDRVTGGLSLAAWVTGALGTSVEIPAWTMQRFYPWPAAAVGALLLIGIRRWFRHPLAPAILWVLVVMAFYVPVWQRTATYVLPAYPGLASLAAFGLVTGMGRRRLRPAAVAALGLGVILGLGALRLALPFETRAGDNQNAFVRAARPLVGHDAVAFVGIRDRSLITLFGVHQMGDASPTALAAARWVVRPVDLPSGGGEELVLASKPVRGPRHGRADGRQILGLYRRPGHLAGGSPPAFDHPSPGSFMRPHSAARASTARHATRPVIAGDVHE